MRLSLSILLATASLVGCAAPQPGRRLLAAPAPAFDVAAFFTGRTEGVGVFHRVFHTPKAMLIEGDGRFVEGRLLLNQRIMIRGETPWMRTWDLRETTPGRWQGTRTDAVGKVTAKVEGNTLHLRYDEESGLAVDERVYLSADGLRAEHRGTTNRLGLLLARTEGTLRRVD